MSIGLDKIDRMILYELDKNARIPDLRLAKKVGRSKESVRYRIRQLQKKEIITGFYILVDTTKLGYKSYKVYLNLSNIPESKNKLVKYLKNESRIIWLGIADGEWDLGITFYAKNNLEFFKFINNLLTKFENLVLKKEIASQVNSLYCTRDFLIGKSTREFNLAYAEVIENKIDGVDIKIIGILFKNSRASLVEISQTMKSSVDIVRRRIKRLEEKGIILKYSTEINYRKIGYEYYKTFLYFKHLNDEEENKVKEYVRQNPNILELVKVIARWEMEISVMVKNYSEYNKIINELKQEFSGIVLDVDSAILSESVMFPNKQLFQTTELQKTRAL